MNTKTAIKPGKAILYYDGCCSLCLREIERLEQLKSDDLELVDIHHVPPGNGLPGRDALLRNLHLRMPDGRLLTGVEADVQAWQYTPYGLWFRWMNWPLLRRIADRAYRRWARWRYDRLYRHDCTACEES